jgi:putative NIF3 family GTP cyclohydrolase 1 type 2
MSNSIYGTRRAFLGGTAGWLAVRRLAAMPVDLTAAQLIERIQKNVGVTWRATTVDTIKAGSPETVVNGIATTMVATLDLLKRAAAAKRNFIVVHEPTFYSGAADEFNARNNATDPLVLEKKKFIEDNSLVVWRFHDHWHAQKPDGIIRGMGIALGWEKYQVPDNVRLYNPPKTTLEDLAKYIKQRLEVRAIRVIGDPKMPVASVAFNPGSTNVGLIQRYMSGTEADVLVCGEPGEWDAGEYVRDTVASGKKKAMIVLGHDMSEEGGMAECARWLKTFITDVPVEFMAAGEAFWTPKG